MKKGVQSKITQKKTIALFSAFVRECPNFPRDLLLLSDVVPTTTTTAASAEVSRGRRTTVRKHGSRRPPPLPPCRSVGVVTRPAAAGMAEGREARRSLPSLLLLLLTDDRGLRRARDTSLINMYVTESKQHLSIVVGVVGVVGRRYQERR